MVYLFLWLLFVLLLYFSLVVQLRRYNISNNFKEPAVEPGIKTFLTGDIYMTLKSTGYKYDLPSLVLTKNELYPIPIDSTFLIRIIKYDMSGLMGGGSQSSAGLGAVIEFMHDTTKITDTIYIVKENEGFSPKWKNLANSNIRVGFVRFVQNPDDLMNSQSVFCFTKQNEPVPQKLQVMTLDISDKPFMLLVWIGSILCIIGFIIPLTKKKK